MMKQLADRNPQLPELRVRLRQLLDEYQDAARAFFTRARLIRGSLHWHIRPSATGEKRYPALNRKVAGTVSDRRVRVHDVAWVEEGVAAQRALRQAARQLRALHGRILAQAARLHTALLYDYEPRAAATGRMVKVQPEQRHGA
jgi:hypothetical protein